MGNMAERIGAHLAGLEEEYWYKIKWVEEEMMMMMMMKVGLPMNGLEFTCVNVLGYGAVFVEGEKGKLAHVSCRIGGVVEKGW